jgi:membrane-bound metal-dependent hydrolase YbcI (DUF457 family)
MLGDMKRFHNNITHSFFFGSLVSLLVAWFWSGRDCDRGFARRFANTFLLYALHLLTDFLGPNKRGLMLLAPFSSRRFRAPFQLFSGVRWDLGLFNRRHIGTLGSELLFLVLIIKVVRKLQPPPDLR